MIGRLRGVVVISDVYSITIPQDIAIYAVAQKVISAESGIQNPFCVILRGHTETTCLIEKALAGKLSESIGPKIIAQQAGLAALIVTREIVHQTEIGGLSYPLQVLAEHGILARNVTATKHEEVIVIDDKDADMAASILRKAMER